MIAPSKAAAIRRYQEDMAKAAARFEAHGPESLRAVWQSDRQTYDILVRCAIGDGGDASAYEHPTDAQLEDLAARVVEKLRAGGDISGYTH